VAADNSSQSLGTVMVHEDGMGGVGTNRKDAKHSLKSLPPFFLVSISVPTITTHLFFMQRAAIGFGLPPSDSGSEQNAAHAGGIS
jgi:hypothetical protein